MRRFLGLTLLMLGGVPLALLAPDTIIWAIHECHYLPSNCHPIPYRAIASLTLLLLVVFAGVALLIGSRR